MKNKTNLIIAVSIIFLFAAGCGIADALKKSGEPANTNSSVNRTKNDAPENTDISETNLDGKKIGIPECDEAFDLLTDEMKPKEDESYIAKATRRTILNSIRDSFKESIKNEKDRSKLTEDCKKYLEQLKKYKAEESEK